MITGCPSCATRDHLPATHRADTWVGDTLRDRSGGETCAWTLEGAGTRTVEPGEASSFLTRVAAPPANVEDVEIRFARGD